MHALSVGEILLQHQPGVEGPADLLLGIQHPRREPGETLSFHETFHPSEAFPEHTQPLGTQIKNTSPSGLSKSSSICRISCSETALLTFSCGKLCNPHVTEKIYIVDLAFG